MSNILYIVTVIGFSFNSYSGIVLDLSPGSLFNQTPGLYVTDILTACLTRYPTVCNQTPDITY